MKSCMVILVAGVLALAFNGQRVAAQDWWPMFQHDTSNTGFSTSNGPNTSQISWIYETSMEIQSPPALSNGRIFVEHPVGLCCLDAVGNGDGTTNLVWSFDIEIRPFSSPAIWNGRVYSASYSGPVYCVEAEGNGDGTTNLIWSYSIVASVNSSPAVAANRVYLNYHQGVICLDAVGNGDGTTSLIWDYPYRHPLDNSRDSSNGKTVPIAPASSVAFANGMVYVGSRGEGDVSYVLCLDALGNGDGTTDLIWSFATGINLGSSPTVAYGNVYIGDADNTFYCLDGLGNGDGTTDLIWNFETDNTIFSSPAVYDGRVYVASGETTYCLDASGNEDGTTDLIWSFPEGCYYGIAVADEKVYLGGIYCLDAVGNGDGTTNLIWSYSLEEGTRSSPAIAEGRVFIGSGNFSGKVYAFGPATEQIPTLSEWSIVILCLLLLAIGTVAVIRRRKEAFANEH